LGGDSLCRTIAQLTGWAMVNGEERCWFFVKAIENREPRIGSDTFEMTTSDRSGSWLTTVSTAA